MADKTKLRTYDFRAALCLIAATVFFLWETSSIPFFNTRSAGVDSADWYNSAALIPYGIFGALLVLSISLLVIAIRGGGARADLAFLTDQAKRAEVIRIILLGIILLSYIGGLVPRVDFIIASGLTLTALIWGFHFKERRNLVLSVLFTALPALYAFTLYTDRSEWSSHWDDDVIALVAWVAMTGVMFWTAKRQGNLTNVMKATPLMAVFVPLLLVAVMAFGFRQNVPNRTGLIFSQIEYHYYVTIRPMFQGE